MANADLKEFRSYSDRISADAVASLLSDAGVPAMVTTTSSLAEIGTKYIIWVPAELHHRAVWIANQSDFTEAELTFLATGELPE